MQRISFLVVSHGHDHFIRPLVRSLRARPDLSKDQIIVVDNIGSFDSDLKRFLIENDVLLVVNIKRRGFSANNNIAASIADGDYIFLLNPDTELISFDRAVFSGFERNVLYFPELKNVDGSVQNSGRRYPSFFRQVVVFGLTFFGRRLEGIRGSDWYFAAAMIADRDFFFRLGGFEEAFPLYCEDTEICHRASLLAGGVKLIEDVSVLHHLGGEGKGRFKGRAVVSNLLLRFFMAKNYFRSLIGVRV